MNATLMPPRKKLSLWVFTDNKPGHRNQLEGLINAMADQCEVECMWFTVDRPFFEILTRIRRQADVSRPAMVFGAGHKTHKFLLLARLFAGGRSIVLMKPSLPLCWFDKVLIPAHDGSYDRKNVIGTQGVINKIEPSLSHDKNKGLFLIGGPSKHADWDNGFVLEQIETLVDAQPDMCWQLTTSRRTPEDFLLRAARLSDKIELIPHQQTDGDWLPRQLSVSGQVWVTEDSVSMVYEALTSGAATGLLALPNPRPGRVRRGIDDLIKNGLLQSYATWLQSRSIATPPYPLHEARRCAELLMNEEHGY
ncbi:MAG: mitochondrial fission ELM1 family protein [Gammaproteobacteria bacterium]